MAFPVDYTKYQEVTVDNTKVTADLTDFSVYVNLADLDKISSDIFDTVTSSGGDIRVTKSDGTTELAREVVAINVTAKTGELHIKFTGTLSSTTDTTIRIWYNGIDTEPATTATYGRNAVWSGYTAVYHLQEDPSGTAPQMIDSTGTYDGTSNGTMTSGDSVASQIENGLDFDGVDDYISMAAMGISGSQNRTVSYWFNTTTTGALYGVNWGATSTANIWAQTVETDVVGVRISEGYRTFTLTGSQDGNWHYQSCQLNGTLTDDIVAYGDGATLAQDALLSNTLNTTDTGYKIALEPGGGFYTGKIDEVRISIDVKGADWANTEYANQNNSSTFYTTSNELTTTTTDNATFFGCAF